jgi:coenzyme F420-reducing hydrogenase delta subunit
MIDEEMVEETAAEDSVVEEEEQPTEAKETQEPDVTESVAQTPAVEGFEPKIIGFLCNWCSYAGADLCGVSRYQYPTNIRVIRVMCSTRVDPYLIVNIFKSGADGVFMGGCHIGDCHYISGNYHTERKIKLVKNMLERAGFDPERLRLEWISASEGERFSKVITEFTNEIKAKGPSPINGPNPDKTILNNLEAAEMALLNFKLRALVGKEYKLTSEGNVYGEIKSQDDWDEMMEVTISNEFVRNRILQLTGDQPYSVIDLSKEIQEPKDKILEQIVYLRKRNMVAMSGIDGTTPKYISLMEGVD